MNDFNLAATFMPVVFGLSDTIPRNLVGQSRMLHVRPDDIGKVVVGLILLPSNASETHLAGFKWRSSSPQQASIWVRDSVFIFLFLVCLFLLCFALCSFFFSGCH